LGIISRTKISLIPIPRINQVFWSHFEGLPKKTWQADSANSSVTLSTSSMVADVAEHSTM